MKERERSLLYVMRLVQEGLRSGNVKSKPIISFEPNAESCDMQSLEDLVDKALAGYEPKTQ